MFPCSKKIHTQAVQEEVDDVLVELFSFLDAESLKNAALVCKTWDRLIGSSAVTMKKLVLRIDEKDGEENEFDYEFVSTRRHQNVKLTSRKDGVRSLDNFDVLHAKTFEIIFQGSTVPIWLILSQMTMLKCLTFNNLKFNGDAQQVNLQKLVQLTTNSASDDTILQCIRADNLEIFECMVIEAPHKAVEFLKSCEKLKSLRLSLLVVIMLLDFEAMFSMKFQLTELTIYPLCSPLCINVDSLSKFLISQSNSLTTLNINTFRFFVDLTEVCKTFSKLTKLTNLCMRDTYFGDTFSQRIEVKPMRSLKELSSYLPHLSADRFELLMKRLPKLETLTYLFPNSEALSDDIINIIGRQPMLKRVNFVGESNQMASIFDNIKTNYGRLKIMLFVLIDFGQGIGGEERSIRFDMPEDSIQWNVQEQEERFRRVKNRVATTSNRWPTLIGY